MHKTLIEEGNFDLIRLFHLVGEEAKKEKNAIPPINKLLYWWTRKPLVVARAVYLSSTLTDIDDVKHLIGFSSTKRAFNYEPNLDFFIKKLDRPSS